MMEHPHFHNSEGFMRTLAPLIVILVCAVCTSQAPTQASQAVTADANQSCAPLGTSLLRTTLYFGLTHDGGAVSEGQWQAFLRDEVTPRFPAGLTVWSADGQWRRPDGRIGRERAKVLLIVHDNTPAVRAALGEVVTTYKRAYQQESVLWETAPVCATF
jgi:hypothetical protein